MLGRLFLLVGCPIFHEASLLTMISSHSTISNPSIPSQPRKLRFSCKVIQPYLPNSRKTCAVLARQVVVDTRNMTIIFL